jgi:hypothetical protein
VRARSSSSTPGICRGARRWNGSSSGCWRATRPGSPRPRENWRLDRLGVVEQNILRLALFEMEGGEVPPKVAINEAVQLAHWFAGNRAPAFVNGVLDALARRAGWL